MQRLKRDVDVVSGHVVFDYDTARELAGATAIVGRWTPGGSEIPAGLQHGQRGSGLEDDGQPGQCPVERARPPDQFLPGIQA